MAQDTFKVGLSPRGLTNTADGMMSINASGAGIVLDFLTNSLLDGRGYQIRDGVLTTPVAMDIEVTTVAAEMSHDSVAGMVLIPFRYVVSFESLNGGTLPQWGVKMTATASTAGTAFTPLPLLTGGRAASSTARAAAAGGVTVVADVSSTTRVLWMTTQAAVLNDGIDVDLWGRGIVNGAGNIYVSGGSVTAGAQHFHALSTLEFTTGALGLA